MSIVYETSIPSTAAFDAIADTYDDSFSNSSIGRAQRKSVRAEIDREFHARDRILELNCGTGIDAAYMALRAIKVTACDSAPRMIAVARQRLDALSLQTQVDLRLLPIEHLSCLAAEEPYDGVFSNFAGLNCVEDLRSVARDLAQVVKPGGIAILCLFGRFCLWEVSYYLARAEFRKAFRRVSRDPVVASLGPGSEVTVRYASVPAVRRMFSPHFRLKRWKGVGVAVPPSYLEPLTVRFPRLFRASTKVDDFVGQCPGLRGLADHVVLTFERCGGERYRLSTLLPQSPPLRRGGRATNKTRRASGGLVS